MRILLTNDDGFSSPGITLLAKSLRNAGHRVFLVAPDKNRSGCSHSIEFLNGAIKLNKIETDTWSCSGTPVDCVIIALLGGIPEICITTDGDELNLKNGPDLVLSGINSGANLGTDIIYSGTAAAARQGSILGFPSVALSLVDYVGPYYWEPVIEYIIENLDTIKGFWKAGAFVNINFPNSEKKPLNLVHSFPSIRYYNDKIINFTVPKNGIFCFTDYGETVYAGSREPKEGSDWAEVLKNNAAYSIVENQPVLFSMK